MAPILFFLTSFLLPIIITKYMNNVRCGSVWFWHLLAYTYCIGVSVSVIVYFVSPQLLPVSKQLFSSISGYGVTINLVATIWVLLLQKKRRSDSLKSELDKAIQEVNILKRRNQSLEDKIAHRKSLSSEVEQSRKDISQYKREIQSLQDRLSLALKGIDPSLQQKLDKTVEALAMSQRECQSIKSRMANVHRQLDSKNQEIAQLNTMVENLTAEKERLNALCLSLADKLNSTNKQIDICKMEITMASKR